MTFLERLQFFLMSNYFPHLAVEDVTYVTHEGKAPGFLWFNLQRPTPKDVVEVNSLTLDRLLADFAADNVTIKNSSDGVEGELLVMLSGIKEEESIISTLKSLSEAISTMEAP